jgi:hypothetical protein
MSTSFSNKIEILSEVHAESLWNESLKDFKEVNDIGLPLAYLVQLELCTISDEGKGYVEETWNMLCEALKVDPNGTYETSDELLANFPAEEEE